MLILRPPDIVGYFDASLKPPCDKIPFPEILDASVKLGHILIWDAYV
jgi:hypothetical protein